MLTDIIAWVLVIAVFVGLFVVLPLRFLVWNMQKKQQRRVTPALVCPTCHVMGSVQPISSTHKVGSAAAIGVFSLGRIGKTFRCTNCGYVW